MTTRAVLVKNKKDRYGRYPIKICVTIKRKRTYYTTGKRIFESEWNGSEVKKTVPGAAAMNLYLRKMIHQTEMKINSLHLSSKPVTIQRISRTIRDKNTDDAFLPYANALVSDMKKRKFSPGTIRNYNKYLKKIKKFSHHFHFSDVDQKWLRKFEGSLHSENLANNTIHACFKVMKKIFNSARKDGVTDNYPFSNYDNPKYRQTERTFLLIEEVEKIEELLTKPIPEYFTVTINYFLLGFFSGIRFGDWSRFNPGFVQGDRLLLRTTKTGEIVSVKMHRRLKEIVERLKDLPPIYSEPKTNFYLKGIAKMAGIKKNLTTHVARHSYCTHCLRLKIPDSVIAKSMGISLKTLNVYRHLLDSSVDEEMEKWNKKSPADQDGT